jgi:hypothetical protein
MATGIRYRRLQGFFCRPTARNFVFLMRRDANVPAWSEDYCQKLHDAFTKLIIVINPNKLCAPGVKDDDGDVSF